MSNILVEARELKTAMKMVAPALISLDFAPILGHYCFDKSTGLVYAFNDSLALAVETDLADVLDCGVPNLLFKTLTDSDENVSIEVKESVLNLRFSGRGKAHVKIPTLSKEVFLFDPPTDSELKSPILDFELDKGFVGKLTKLLKLTGEDVLDAFQTGVTLIVRDGEASVYSTDARTLSLSNLSMDVDVSYAAVVLPKMFCEQLVSWYDSGASLVLKVFDSFVWVDADWSGNREGFIYSKLLHKSDGCETLENVYDKNIKGVDLDDLFVKVGEDLIECVGRAVLFGQDLEASIKVFDDFLDFRLESDSGSFKQEIAISVGDCCPDEFKINLGVLERALKLHDNISVAFLKGCLYFETEDGLFHLTAISSEGV